MFQPSYIETYESGLLRGKVEAAAKLLAGRHGSGTIFPTGCNLLCSYCQNYERGFPGYGLPHLGPG